MIVELNCKSRQKFEVIDINADVAKAVEESGVEEGICVIYARHATAAIIINESADPNIQEDFIEAIGRIVPLHNDYLHDRIDNNAAAHIKAALLGPSKTVPVKNRRLCLGTWQSIMLADFDGPRKRNVMVQIISAGSGAGRSAD